ncbi:MAG: hypothetical protein ACLQVD_04370 [Capsulimonadaceae bacterium]
MTLLIALAFGGLTTGAFAQSSAAPVNAAGTPPAAEACAAPVKAPGGRSSTSPTAVIANEPVADRNSVVLENADSAEQLEPGHWIAAGNVGIIYRDEKITCDRVDLDTDSDQALFRGHVVLTGPNQEEVTGGASGSLSLDLDNNTYVVSDARTTISPKRLGAGMILPLILYGGTVSGRPNFVDARGSSFTTCDFPQPHYHFTARDAYVIPGRHLVGKQVSLYRRERRLITIPYLVVPLNKSASTLNPQFGESPQEGYYVKLALGYVLADTLPGILHVDMFQKKGIGLGFDQSYGSESTNPRSPTGEVTAYELPDHSTGLQDLAGSIQHKQEFGDVMASVNGQFQQNSYLLSDQANSSDSGQLLLNRTVGNLTDTFATNLTSSTYVGSTTQSLTSNLDQVFNPTRKERFETKLNFTQDQNTFFGTSTTTGQVNGSVEYDEQDRYFDWKFMENKTQSVGESGGQIGTVEKLPELDMATDPIRETVLRTLLPKTAQLSLSLGNYNEPASLSREDRINYGLDLGSTTRKVTSWEKLDFDGSYQQRFYSDDAAQYVLTEHSDYKLRIGSKSAFVLKYDYVRAYGYSPFLFDIAGNTNLISANLSYQETRELQLNFSTGYDIYVARQPSIYGPPQPYQSASLQSLYTPTKLLSWRQSTAYNINDGQLTDLTDNFTVLGSNKMAFDLGTRYAPPERRMADITGDVNVPFWWHTDEDSGWRLQAIAGYDGLTDSYDYSGLAVTRSWHDWETTLIYQNNPIGFETGATLTFNIRLKAFPAYEPFGVGNFGQSLSSGLGTVY